MKLYPHYVFREPIRLLAGRGTLLPLGALLTATEVDEDQGVIRLQERDIQIYPQVRLTVEIQISRTEMTQYLEMTGGGPDGGVTATIIAHCRASRLRQAATLYQSKTEMSAWSGEFDLDRRNLRGITELRAVLTGTQNGRPHRLLGTSNIWRIVSDSTFAPSVSGDFTPDIQWLNFRGSEAPPYIQKEGDQPFFVDLSGEMPIVFLNSGFNGLRSLFPTDRRPEGALFLLHEALSVGISRSTWHAMFHASLSADSQGADPSTETEFPQGWQGIVLNHLLPKLYPGMSLNEALQQALYDRVTSIGAANLETRLFAVISGIVGEGKALRRALSTVQAMSGELPQLEE